MVLITALALAALNAQIRHERQYLCDLTPYLGGGSSSEGQLDSMSGLGLGCVITLYGLNNWTIGPRLELTEQRWSVFQNAEAATLLNNYQARTLGLGLQTEWALSSDWKVAYSLTFGLGTGSQNQNLSTSTSTQNVAFSGMIQRNLRQQVSLRRQINSRLSLLAGLQWDNARQSWDAASGRLDQENVAPGNRLTLSSGSSASLPSSQNHSSHYQAFNIMLGVQMDLGAPAR